MLVNILIITNSILNLFFGLILGIVSFSAIKRIKDNSRELLQKRI